MVPFARISGISRGHLSGRISPVASWPEWFKNQSPPQRDGGTVAAASKLPPALHKFFWMLESIFGESSVYEVLAGWS